MNSSTLPPEWTPQKLRDITYVGVDDDEFNESPSQPVDESISSLQRHIWKPAPEDQWSLKPSSGHKKGYNSSYNNWYDQRDCSQHSTGSIWADEASTTSISMISPTLRHDDHSSPTQVDSISESLAHLSMGYGAPRSFHGSIGSNLGFQELPAPPLYMAQGSGSVSSSIPGLTGASSSSTGGTSWYRSQDLGTIGSQASPVQPKKSSLQAALHTPPPGFHANTSESFVPPPPEDRNATPSRPTPGRSTRKSNDRQRTPRQQGKSMVAVPPLKEHNTDGQRSVRTEATGESSSAAIRQLMHAKNKAPTELEISSSHSTTGTLDSFSILPLQMSEDYLTEEHSEGDDSLFEDGDLKEIVSVGTSIESKKTEWLTRMNRKLAEVPIGELDPSEVPLAAVMNSWAKTKSAHGAAMVEMWLQRAQKESNAGNHLIVPTAKMYTMAVDAWARSGEGAVAAQRAEALLQRMNELYQSGGHDQLRPTTGIFNAVLNAWARSKTKMAPQRAEQILSWMQNFDDADVRPDRYTFNTVLHSYAKAGGGQEAAVKASELLRKMHDMYRKGNHNAKPDTISYNVVCNCWAKSGGNGAVEAEKLLAEMHELNEAGDRDIKPNAVTYGAVLDAYAKSGKPDAAQRADRLLAKMISLYQSDPDKNRDLAPTTFLMNTVINAWAKAKEPSKAEEMLVAMTRMASSKLQPDTFTYTCVIDAWSKSGFRGAATRAHELLDRMEELGIKANSYTFNAVIAALAKSGEAARAERVLMSMVNRGDDDARPTTINFNTCLDAYAKSGGGRAAAERAEEILQWMSKLHRQGNRDVQPDTISFNAVLDAWARSGDRMAPRRAEAILDHMDELYRAGERAVKPDVFSYNTLINAYAKCSLKGSAQRAEYILTVMEKRYRDGDTQVKPNTRTMTSVIDAWAKSGEAGAAEHAEQLFDHMLTRYESSGEVDVKPNVHTANAVCNACAFSKHPEDKELALKIALRVFKWLSGQSDMKPDSYSYTILLSVCGNLIDEPVSRFEHARFFFESARDAGYVNDYVLRKLRVIVSEQEYMTLVGYHADNIPAAWSRNTKASAPNRSRRGNSNHNNNNSWSGRRRGR